MEPSTVQLLATILFALAILHTFMVKRFETFAKRFPEGSVPENFFHLLGEVEVVFGVWAAIFLVAYGIILSPDATFAYLDKTDFTEPLFVFAIMAMAATQPILQFVKSLIEGASKILPFNSALSFYIACLILGPILGSFITEPAAMTVTALLLKEAFYDKGMSKRFMYATIGLLFVSISIGGTLTHFAAPPVVMVAHTWNYDIMYMLTHFGWKASVAIVISTLLVAFAFRKELALEKFQMTGKAGDENTEEAGPRRSPMWLILLHIFMIAGVVMTSHHMAAFMGLFLLFLGVTGVTKEYQIELKLKESLLVGYFLMGLVVLGGLQDWWLKPLLSGMNDVALYFGATALTAITDNAALTFLGSQVDGLSHASQYALVAGAVAGGGLTVIANAPNPAGFGILKSSFGSTGISPLGLLLAALPPTIIALLAFELLPHLA